MKAREYAAQFRDNPTNETLVEIARAFYAEILTIKQMRNAKYDLAFIAILNEQNRKWRAFVNLAGENVIRPDGFERFIEAVSPEIYQGWRVYGIR